MMLRQSITLRLTLLFASASTLVLLMVGTVIGLVVERHFEEQDLVELQGKLELIRHTLVRVSTPAELAAVPQQLDDALIGHAALSVLVLKPDGKTLFSTPAPDFPLKMLQGPQTPPAKTVLETWLRGEHAYIGIAGVAMTAIPGAKELHVALALDTEHHHEFMRVFRNAVWLAVVMGMLLSGVLGWLAARSGLSQVRKIAEVAKGISVNQLNDRLQLTAVPKELLEMAESFNAMLSRLEDAFRRLNNFSSDIAHELRAPVSNLMTQTQVALSRVRSQAEYRDILSSNVEEYDRLARMIADMLFLAKADHGLIIPQSEAIDLALEVQELVEFYEPLAEEQGVRIAVSGAAQTCGDRLMLRRVLSNLLSNALRHTARGKSIFVTLESASEREVCVIVGNPGEDIPESHIQHVFERFYRVDPAREQGGEGAGLGLAITKSIVTAHGGSISVVSLCGYTRFEILLPQYQLERL